MVKACCRCPTAAADADVKDVSLGPGQPQAPTATTTPEGAMINGMLILSAFITALAAPVVLARTWQLEGT